MPNVEVYSCRKCPGDIRADVIYNFVDGALRRSGLKYDEVIITDHGDDICRNLTGKQQPFIRICGTDEKEIDAIVELLQPLGYDIETLVLTSFYPGKK